MRTVIYLLEKRFIKGKPATQELIKGHSATCVYSEEEFTDKFENGELPPSHIFIDSVTDDEFYRIIDEKTELFDYEP